MKFILEAKTPHLQAGDVIIPVKQHPLDQGMCSLEDTFKAIPQTTVRDKPVVPHKQAGLTQNMAYSAAAWTIDETFGKPQPAQHDNQVAVAYAASTASADTWHRRLGHMNPKNMDLLRKQEGNGLEYSDNTLSLIHI